MMIEFTIFQYDEIDGKFKQSHELVYDITFIPTSTLTKWNICVNGALTNKELCLITDHYKFKNTLLKAISYYVNTDKQLQKPKASKIITEGLINLIYSKKIKRRIAEKINKPFVEKSRDVLTKYYLINII